jgi:hypothetical protein
MPRPPSRHRPGQAVTVPAIRPRGGPAGRTPARSQCQPPACVLMYVLAGSRNRRAGARSDGQLTATAAARDQGPTAKGGPEQHQPRTANPTPPAGATVVPQHTQNQIIVRRERPPLVSCHSGCCGPQLRRLDAARAAAQLCLADVRRGCPYRADRSPGRPHRDDYNRNCLPQADPPRGHWRR